MWGAGGCTGLQYYLQTSQSPYLPSTRTGQYVQSLMVSRTGTPQNAWTSTRLLPLHPPHIWHRSVGPGALVHHLPPLTLATPKANQSVSDSVVPVWTARFYQRPPNQAEKVLISSKCEGCGMQSLGHFFGINRDLLP